MRTWKCSDCGGQMKVVKTATVAMCPFCGGTKIALADSEQRMKTYAQYDRELEAIAKRLNEIGAESTALTHRYGEILQYFRQQKCRGLITQEEYEMRARRYRYFSYRPRKKKEEVKQIESSAKEEGCQG